MWNLSDFKQMMGPVVCGFNPCHISTFVLLKKQESIKTCYPPPQHNNKTTPKTSESLKNFRTEKASKTLEKLKYGYCKFVSLVGKILRLTNMINMPRTLVNWANLSWQKTKHGTTDSSNFVKDTFLQQVSIYIESPWKVSKDGATLVANCFYAQRNSQYYAVFLYTWSTGITGQICRVPLPIKPPKSIGSYCKPVPCGLIKGTIWAPLKV